MNKQQPSPIRVGADVSKLFNRETRPSSFEKKPRFNKIRHLAASCSIHSFNLLKQTPKNLSVAYNKISISSRAYPSKPEVRNHHWCAAAIVVCISSWVSINSTASIRKTSLNSIGLEEPLASPGTINLLGDSQQTLAIINNQSPSVQNKNTEAIVDHSLLPEEKIANLNIETITHTVKPGDTLGRIFAKLSLPRTLPSEIVATEEGKRLKNIAVGKTLEFELENGEFRKLNYKLSTLKQLSVAKHQSGEINAKETTIDFNTRIKQAEGTIESSLFLAGHKAGISENLIMELAGIFGWDIDFVRDIRKGDSFKLMHEEFHKDNNALGEGKILAAEFINKGQKFTAIRYEDSDGGVGYYSEDGKNMRGTFLKSPMKFSRVSSGFSRKRFHPVLKKWRAHKGVDYAARSGTPIRSTANGKVIYKGTKGGYGRTVIISHGGKYSTLYAHMSKYGKNVRSGKHVKQGQTIGYVGASGLATGPHLHYEFRLNGIHRNPLTFKTPKATALPKKELSNFRLVALQQLAHLNGSPLNSHDKHDIQIASSLNQTSNPTKAIPKTKKHNKP